MTNEEFERMLEMPIKKETTVSILIGMQEEYGKLGCVLSKYNVTRQELTDKYITELLMPGMTLGVAWHTMGFLSADVEKGTSSDSLVQAIRDNILAAGVYMTNVSVEERRELEGRQYE